jgi:preprotein translocase SecE subunit
VSSSSPPAPLPSGPVAYLTSLKTEWTKIAWPTPLQLWSQVMVVLVTVSLTTVGLWGVDNLLRLVIKAVVPASASRAAVPIPAREAVLPPAEPSTPVAPNKQPTAQQAAPGPATPVPTGHRQAP